MRSFIILPTSAPTRAIVAPVSVRCLNGARLFAARSEEIQDATVIILEVMPSGQLKLGVVQEFIC